MKPEETKNKSGTWTNGTYTIQWIDSERVKVTKHWPSFDEYATLYGGDFESILNTLFVDAELKRVSHDNFS